MRLVTCAAAFCGVLFLFGMPALGQRSQPFEIGAWYFGLWTDKEPSQQIRNAERFYSRRDIWAGIRDCVIGCYMPGIEAPKESFSAFQNRTPLAGFYDMSDESVVAKHALDAASAGLSFFAVYWYLDGKTGKPQYDPSPHLRRAQKVIKYALAPIILGEPMSPKTWADIAIPEIISNLSTPNYLRIENQPAIILFDLRFTDPGYTAEAVALLRRRALHELGTAIHVVQTLPPNPLKASFHSYADAFTCHVFDVKGAPEAYADYRARWMTETRRQIALTDRPYIPCPVVGFDARPWFWIAGGPNPARQWRTADERPYLIGNTVDAFRQHLAEAKIAMQETTHMAIIYAWNEWGEGGAIEPSRNFGFVPLDAIRSTFGLHPTTPRVCTVEAPGCP